MGRGDGGVHQESWRCGAWTLTWLPRKLRGAARGHSPQADVRATYGKWVGEPPVLSKGVCM